MLVPLCVSRRLSNVATAAAATAAATTSLRSNSKHLNRGFGFRNMSTRQKPNVVFVLGGPGAGKGTQCQKIVEKYGFEHLSAGDLLRAERKNPASEYGELIETHIRNGTIVPVEITCSLLVRAMAQSPKDDFLIDGFPRNEDNLQGWEREVGDGKADVKFVLFFKCDKETCVKRCLDRGAAGSGRSDDNLESLEKRFDTYLTATMPIVEYYRAKDLVEDIDGTEEPDRVFEAVKKVFEKRLK